MTIAGELAITLKGEIAIKAGDGGKAMNKVTTKIIGNKWDEVLGAEFEKDYFKNLMSFLGDEYEKEEVYPPREMIFSALKHTDYDDVKVVILAQDPYPNKNQANGIAFAVNKGQALPRSLKNIYKEIESDVNVKMPASGELIGWARQGVLLLNTILTYRERKAEQPNNEPNENFGIKKSTQRKNAHERVGWQTFTDEIIKSLNKKNHPVVYLLFGDKAKKKAELIANKQYIIQSAHPSPQSVRLFKGSKPFSRANAFLSEIHNKTINWQDVE